MKYKLKFHYTKQFIYNNFWLPASFSVGLEKEWYDTFGISFYFPKINNGTIENPMDDGSKSYGIKLPTKIMLNIDRNMYCGVVIKLLGWGIGIHRQWNY